jgi:hypothetical protein
MSELQAVRDVLRALGDVRDGPFYKLYVDLPDPVERPHNKIEFRIRRIADNKNAFAFVRVSLTRADWIEVSWSLTVETTDEALIVTGAVELETGEDTVEVYTNAQTLHNLADVKDTIHTLADQVCGERSWVTRSLIK